MNESGENVSVPRQEKTEPVTNMLEGLEKIHVFFRNATRRSLTASEGGRVDRPLFLRTSRAELYKEASKSKEDRKRIIEEARARDEIAKKYLNQGEVTVDLPDLGKQTARYVVIEPPESRKTPDTETKPAIFIIPGISNDLDCVGALINEIAFSGRKVIAVAFPESHMGQITPEFVRAVEGSPDYSPHAAFFKNAILQLYPEGSDIELWGHSTGAPIIEQILLDPEFQERTAEAVLLCPASSASISDNQMKLGLALEVKALLKHFRSFPKYTLTGGAKENNNDKDQDKLRTRVFGRLYSLVRKPILAWQEAKVRPGGKVVVVSSEKDFMTRSFDLFNPESIEALKAQNQQITVLELKGGSHGTPLIEPGKVIQKVFEAQE